MTTTEQAHASGAVLLRDHSQYSESTLVDRATLHAGRSLFMRDALGRTLAALDKALKELDRKQPNTVSARNLFFRRCAADKRAGGVVPSESAFEAMQAPMRAHSEAWEQLPVAERRRFEREAMEFRAHMRGQMEAKRAEIQEDIAQSNQEYEEHVERRGLTNHFASCRFTEAELEAFLERLKEKNGVEVAASGLWRQTFL